MSNQPPSNPYAQAAGTYGDHAQKHTPDQRELEARVLLKAAKMLKNIQNDWDSATSDIIAETLQYNRQIWMMFYDTALENPEGDRPNDLRSNIVNLANFVFKRELEILNTPEKDKFSILISINQDIAAGLLAKQASDSDQNTNKNKDEQKNKNKDEQKKSQNQSTDSHA